MKKDKINVKPIFVDLGITNSDGKKVLWADRNIGADKPEAYGKYFQYGDTVGYEGDEAKAHSTWSTCPYQTNPSATSSSECVWSKYNSTDELTTLEASDDAATVAYGKGYRLPTKDEIQLLIDNTDSEWTTLNGVEGYKFTSKIEGYTDRSIFVSAAGYVSYGSFSSQGSSCGVWSSSLDASNPSLAWYLYFLSGRMFVYNCLRYYGQSLRAVKTEN